ncbi:MAG: hypothetical protein ABSE42_12970 [Bryobacteraceae bacterium]|jgi:hypothetical protein
MDRMTGQTRQRLIALRNGLLHLHKALMESERAAYERDVEHITSTGQYLNLVLNDPWFSWLRELSQFVVMVDETLDQKEKEPASDEDAGRLIAQARVLVAPAEEGDRFGRSYWQAMQRDPGAVLAHRDMMRVFAELA